MRSIWTSLKCCHLVKGLTLSQTTNFTLYQIESLQMTNSYLMKIAESSPNGQKTLREKEKLLVTSNFFFSHSVFESIVQQTRKNQGLFGKGLSGLKTHFCSYKGKKSNPLLVTSNFFFSHSVFKSILKQTRKNQGLFGKGLSGLKTHFCSYKGKKSNPLRSIAC